MGRKIALGVIWFTFVVYTIWLTPLDQPDTWPLVWKLLTFQATEVNAIISAIFWLMGIWPMIYAGLLFADGKMQPFRAWPYFIGANFTGVICLIPYFLFRHRNSTFEGHEDQGLKIVDYRLTGLFLLLGTVGLLSWAIVGGNWADYVNQFQTRAFVHLISLDFCLMGSVFPLTSLLDDDLMRRGITNPWIFWAIALLPLFGPLFYLSLQPTLLEIHFEQEKNTCLEKEVVNVN